MLPGTVTDNILLALKLQKVDKARHTSQLQQALETVNLTQLADQTASTLSGGEQRRVAIARVLAFEPDILLLDEPFAGVDPISVLDIKKIIEHLKNRGIGVLITDHNVRETLDVCEKAYIVSHGELIASGTPEHVLNDKTVRDVYLGEQFRL